MRVKAANLHAQRFINIAKLLLYYCNIRQHLVFGPFYPITLIAWSSPFIQRSYNAPYPHPILETDVVNLFEDECQTVALRGYEALRVEKSSAQEATQQEGNSVTRLLSSVLPQSSWVTAEYQFVRCAMLSGAIGKVLGKEFLKLFSRYA